MDAYTIQLMTESPAPTLLLALNRLYIVLMGYAEEAGDGALASQPVGTGPFMLEDFRRDDSVVLVANPDCKHLAEELADDKVRVKCLSPGRILTERTAELDRARAEREGKTLKEVRTASILSIPMGRLGEPEESGREEWQHSCVVMQPPT